jgi:hypothetical protein
MDGVSPLIKNQLINNLSIFKSKLPKVIFPENSNFLPFN